MKEKEVKIVCNRVMSVISSRRKLLTVLIAEKRVCALLRSAAESLTAACHRVKEGVGVKREATPSPTSTNKHWQLF